MGHRLKDLHPHRRRRQHRPGDGTRVSKDHARVEAYGTVDELNSVLGLLLAKELPPEVRMPLTDIQHVLFDAGGELSVPGRCVIEATQSVRLEELLDRLNASCRRSRNSFCRAAPRWRRCATSRVPSAGARSAA